MINAVRSLVGVNCTVYHSTGGWVGGWVGGAVVGRLARDASACVRYSAMCTHTDLIVVGVSSYRNIVIAQHDKGGGLSSITTPGGREGGCTPIIHAHPCTIDDTMGGRGEWEHARGRGQRREREGGCWGLPLVLPKALYLNPSDTVDINN